jgi:hypothetical protein
MPYWLTNPDHGVMPVYSESEVARHIPLGWSLLNQGESPIRPDSAQVLKDALSESMLMDPPPLLHIGPMPEPEPIPNATGEAPIVPLKRKPGRPPKAK